jgi:hypothetical protein
MNDHILEQELQARSWKLEAKSSAGVAPALCYTTCFANDN